MNRTKKGIVLAGWWAVTSIYRRQRCSLDLGMSQAAQGGLRGALSAWHRRVRSDSSVILFVVKHGRMRLIWSDSIARNDDILSTCALRDAPLVR